ncbi:DUF488 domain-containing protein [Maribacter sp. 2308TA10-17]|uniref:DUF488 domain-containing protein n=1 Tax=Maribacter sp. 2308TA10-17 TaxID=3386276 RepID=UPI0039BD20C0
MNFHKTKIKLVRAYEVGEPKMFVRILVDRLWPRGLSKQKLEIDYWEKELAPSVALRKWYHEDLSRWSEFKERYELEMEVNKVYLSQFLFKMAEEEEIHLIYGAKNKEENHAIVLKKFLDSLRQSIENRQLNK